MDNKYRTLESTIRSLTRKGVDMPLEKDMNDQVHAGSYSSKHFEVSASAQKLFASLPKNIDSDTAEKSLIAHDKLFHIHKKVAASKRATKQDVDHAQKLHDEIMSMADEMGGKEKHGHVKKSLDFVSKHLDDEPNTKEKVEPKDLDKRFATPPKDYMSDIKSDKDVDNLKDFHITRSKRAQRKLKIIDDQYNPLGVNGMFTKKPEVSASFLEALKQVAEYGKASIEEKNSTAELAKKAPPYDEVTKKDVLVGRGVLKKHPTKPGKHVLAKEENDDGWYAHHEMHGSKGISKEDWKKGIRLNSKGERVKTRKEEVEQIDELDRDGMVKRYAEKARKKVEYGEEKPEKREAGRLLAGKKRWGGTGGIPAAKVPAVTREETEALDEISKARALNYVGAASYDKSSHASDIGAINQIARTTGTNAAQRAERDKLSKKHGNRSLGIQRAAGKLAGKDVKVPATEEVEQVDERNKENKLKKDLYIAKKGKAAGTFEIDHEKMADEYGHSRDQRRDTMKSLLKSYKKIGRKLTKEDVQEIFEKMSDEQKKGIRKALGPKTPGNEMRKSSASAKALIGLVKKYGKKANEEVEQGVDESKDMSNWLAKEIEKKTDGKQTAERSKKSGLLKLKKKLAKEETELDEASRRKSGLDRLMAAMPKGSAERSEKALEGIKKANKDYQDILDREKKMKTEAKGHSGYGHAADAHFAQQSQKMQTAINMHLRKGKSYNDAVKAAKVHVKEEVELDEAKYSSFSPERHEDFKKMNRFDRIGHLHSLVKLSQNHPDEKLRSHAKQAADEFRRKYLNSKYLKTVKEEAEQVGESTVMMIKGMKKKEVPIEQIERHKAQGWVSESVMSNLAAQQKKQSTQREVQQKKAMFAKKDKADKAKFQKQMSKIK